MVIESLIRAKNLDIFDLNFDISSKEINQVERLGSGKFDIFEGLLRLLYFTIISLIKFNFNIHRGVRKYCFFIGSKNQERAGLPLKKHNLNFQDLLYGSFGKGFFVNSEGLSYLISLFFLPVLIKRYFDTDDEFLRKMMRCRLDRYLHSYGLFVVYSLVFLREKCLTDTLVFSNDHTVWNRTLLEVISYSSSIKSVYIQHANVSQTFPPLRFTYAFLDGLYAKDTYVKIGDTQSHIHCVGCLRMEGAHNGGGSSINKAMNIICCFNKADSDIFILEMLERVKNSVGTSKIAFRMHPADPRKNLQNKLIELGFNDETDVSLDIVSERYSYCFAGNSGIFLEAYSLGMKCFSVRSWFGGRDYYKFEKNKIVYVFEGDSFYNLDNVDFHHDDKYYFTFDEELSHLTYPSQRILYVLSL